jgi:polyisoprenoid-binding protein YceI
MMKTTITEQGTKWNLDITHSEIYFKVKHLMISTVTGQFKQFSGTVETKGDDFSSAKIQFNADVNSIFTNNEQRDAHLRNNDFFDAENFPQISFEGDRLEKIDDEEYKLRGVLTIKGISREVTLDVEFGGLTTDPWGNARAGFSVSGKINRQDFGINFSAVTETGGLLLGNEVKIYAEVQFVKQEVLEAVA